MSKLKPLADAGVSHPEAAIPSPVSSDGIDRRGFLHCMAWAGTGIVWSFARGIPFSSAFGATPPKQSAADFSFIQISDSHIGFSKPANPDVTGTLQKAVDRIRCRLPCAGFPDPYRGPYAYLEARRVRHHGPGTLRGKSQNLLRTGRT